MFLRFFIKTKLFKLSTLLPQPLLKSTGQLVAFTQSARVFKPTLHRLLLVLYETVGIIELLFNSLVLGLESLKVPSHI
jgi:hypothetical protein